jgi:hypothetical protein
MSTIFNQVGQAADQAKEAFAFFDEHVAPHIGLESPQQSSEPSGRQLKSLEENLAEARAALIAEQQQREELQAQVDANRRTLIVAVAVGSFIGGVVGYKWAERRDRGE